MHRHNHGGIAVKPDEPGSVGADEAADLLDRGSEDGLFRRTASDERRDAAERRVVLTGQRHVVDRCGCIGDVRTVGRSCPA